LNKFPKVEVTV